MTKEELVKGISKKAEITQEAASKTVTSIFESLKEALAKGDSFALVGFGSLKVVERSERTGRNPRTGEEITIPAHKTVRFSLGKDLKELLNTKAAKWARKKKK